MNKHEYKIKILEKFDQFIEQYDKTPKSDTYNIRYIMGSLNALVFANTLIDKVDQ